MIKISDIPSNQSCKDVNPELFKLFQKIQLQEFGQVATTNWSEAEVVQWLDLETKGKYLHERLD